MRAAGFKTKLVIPDDENPIDAYRRAVAVLQDPQARQYVGAVAFHIYRIGAPSDWAKLRALASQYKLPLWMTEYWKRSYSTYSGAFDWAIKMHQLLTIGNVNAIFYLWGFFGDWGSGAAAGPISIHFDNGAFVSWSKTSLYYLTGQYSKFVRPGSTRVDASSSDPAVLVSAYKHGRKVVIVATNTAPDARTFSVHVPKGRILRKVSLVQTTATSGLKALKPLRSRHNSFAGVLPAESVTTFLAGRRRR
jgi:O-glycosyl hydrolase